MGEGQHQSQDESQEAARTVARARAVAGAWAARSVEARAEIVRGLRDALVAEAENLADVLVTDTGKPLVEALVHEVASLVDLATYVARRAPRVLAPEEIEPRLFKHRRSYARRVPRGVVGIIASSCFPLYVPFSSVLRALVAGNAVVLKPGGSGERVARMTAALFTTHGLPEGVLSVLSSTVASGEALVRAAPDLVVFSGTREAGRRVAGACGEQLVPFVASFGGNAPAIVRADANLQTTARALVFGCFAHGGQSAARVGRVYAHEDVVDALVRAVHDQTNALRWGAAGDADVDVTGVLVDARRDAARALVRDAVERGAHLVTGMAPAEIEPRDGPEGPFAPVVLSLCNETMRVMHEALLAPVMPIMAVEDDARALALANEAPGLSAYVFSTDLERARSIADQLRAGTVVINDVFTAYVTSELPFGGSRFGAFGGEEGLRQMCELAVVDAPAPRILKKSVFRYPYDERVRTGAERAMTLLFGARSTLRRVFDFL